MGASKFQGLQVVIMDIQKLRYFIAVAENLNFTEAASRLNISQSGLSQQIAELEKYAGAQLIIRNKRPFQLTPAGQVLLKEAYSLISRSEETLRKTRLAANGQIGSLKIGFLGGIEGDFLPAAIREFSLHHPNIDLSLQHYEWGELNKALARDELDIIFTMSYGLDDFPELTGIILFSDVYSVALSRNHRLVAEKTICVTQLASERFVTFRRDSNYLLHDLTILTCAKHGFTPNIMSYFKDLDSILFMVESGLAVSIVPGTVREIVRHGIRIIELEGPNTNFDVMVAWNKNNLNKSIPIFIEQLRSLNALRPSQIRSDSNRDKKISE